MSTETPAIDPSLLLHGVTRLVEDTFARVREPIPDGEYSLPELAAALRDGWIPYYECHKCGWFQTCTFPQRHPANPNRARDIQCGIACTVLSNCLRAWWPRLRAFKRQDIENYMDALFHLVQYVLDSHIGIGTLVDNWNPDWWGPDMSAHITASPLQLRADLDGLAHTLDKVPFDFWKFQIVFVEGEAEERFLRVLRDRRQLSHVARIEVLGGKGNATPERVPLRLLHGQGYGVSLQLDRDGSKTKSYRHLAERVRAFGGTVFIFDKDFESAFPVELLTKAVEAQGVSVDERWLRERLEAKEPVSIVSAINQKYGCSLKKTELGSTLGHIVEQNWGEMLRHHKQNEITRWVMLLQFGERTTQGGTDVESNNASQPTN